MNQFMALAFRMPPALRTGNSRQALRRGRWFAGAAVCGILFAASLVTPAAGEETNAPSPRSPVGDSQIYKHVNGRALKVFIVKPADWQARDRRPGIVFFHGGGWVGGSPSAFNEQAKYLASRGMVCVLVEYRLLKSKFNELPIVCVQDAKSAVRWVRAHAAELGLDARRIAAGGGSAGGHLAAFTAVVPGLDDPQDDLKISPRPDALVLFNPVFDNGPGEWGHNRVGVRYREFSPAHHIHSNTPPTLVLVGTKDKLVPVSTVERYQTAMRAVGARCETRYYQDQPHAFFNRDPYRTLTLIEADRFLESLGWLQGPPTLQADSDSRQPAETRGQADRE